MLKFKKSVQEIDLYGEKFEVRFPTVGELDSFGESMTKSDNEFKTLSGFLSALGLPEDKAKSMELGHLKDLIEVLSTQKKS